MKGDRHILILALCSLFFVLTSCREYTLSEDPSLRLKFSCDTLSFDTVFTAQGSATAQLMVYNPNANALSIERVELAQGTAFHVNVDGEADLSRLTDLQINGGDSLFVFVRVHIDPLNGNNPLLVNDRIQFHLSNGQTQQVELEAYGQNVTRLGSKGLTTVDSYVFTDTLPYIVFDTLQIEGPLTIQAGARIYMHQNACIIAKGDVDAQGSLEQPILIRGDRLDRLFDSVPYLYAGGGWNGIYLLSDQACTYTFRYVDILSGNVGLFCSSTCQGTLPTLTMDGCRIHNHTKYGLVLYHVDAEVVNSEISNCASHCVYTQGGAHHFIHSTIASYFGYTNIRIQNTDKEDVAAVCIYAADSVMNTSTSFYNSIVTGYRTDEVSIKIDTTATQYAGAFVGNYLKTDTTIQALFPNNRYWQKTDTTEVFVNDFYRYKEYIYYDFRPDSLSPVIGIGDSVAAIPYPTDRNGYSRAGLKPDAGCYQYQP